MGLRVGVIVKAIGATSMSELNVEAIVEAIVGKVNSYFNTEYDSPLSWLVGAASTKNRET